MPFPKIRFRAAVIICGTWLCLIGTCPAQKIDSQYELLNRKRVAEAIEVFKLNVEAYPESFNVYDSLGEAYMVNGNKEHAIKNYQKSVELNPQNTNGSDILKRLKQQ